MAAARSSTEAHASAVANRGPTTTFPPINLIRRTIELDTDTDARLREMAKERGQAEAAVLAGAVALLNSVVDIAGADLDEDRRRLAEFRRTRAAAPPQRGQGLGTELGHEG